MSCVGFELLTLGMASSDEDHYSMPLPLTIYLMLNITSLLMFATMNAHSHRHIQAQEIQQERHSPLFHLANNKMAFFV